MNNNIDFEIGLFGLRAVIRTPWKDEYLKELLNKNILEIELNVGKGWRSGNIDFLKSFPRLKSIVILDGALESLTPLHYLAEIESMSISTYSKTPINFNAFPNLIACDFEWIKGSDSLFECTMLKSLAINNYNERSSHAFSQLKYLEKLTLLNSPIENLQGIFSLKNLRYLNIANLKKVTSLKGIENLQQLKALEIQRCKGITTLTGVFELRKIERLLLLDMGNISSIRGIDNLTELRDFLFYESTNIVDGDLSPIMKLKQLAKVSFQNRKHYTLKREDFGKLYFG